MNLYPEYKEAAKTISEEIKNRGYGLMYSHDEIQQMLGLVEPETIPEYKQYSIDRVTRIENLKTELLEEYNLYLHNEYGKGYRVLSPNNQIEIGPLKHLEKAKRQIKKAVLTLTNVDSEVLDEKHSEMRNRRLSKLAFLQVNMKKKNLLAE